MATKTKQPEHDSPLTFEEELVDLEGAIGVNLPPEASLCIGGVSQSQAALLAILDGWREALALRAEYEAELAAWPGLESQGRLFTRAVKVALTRHLDEARATARRRAETARRREAAAKCAHTREVRGEHLRQRNGGAPRGRFPWAG
jgi:hypothetical protein